MFQEIREKVHLLDAVMKYTDMEVIPAGSNTFQLEDKSCPFCDHKDCFKVRVSADSTNFKCFSCGEWGSDAAAFLSVLRKIDLYSAARRVAADFDIPVEATITTHQKIFELAASYFHECLLTSKDEILTKDGRQFTPLEYQMQYRQHKNETLVREMVGWNGGELVRFLQAFDFSDQEMVDSGLIQYDRRTTKSKAFLRKGCFVYPHFVRGLVSHFTQKDPTGETPPYQVKLENRLNGHMFYGQDTATKHKRIIIVEGENDRLSLLDYAADSFGVLVTNGGPSGNQKKWLESNCAGSEIITIFDRDDAGDKYRDRLWNMEVAKLTQYVVPEGFNDIDEFLKKGENASMEALIEVKDPANAPVEGAEVVDGHNVFELDGCYCKLKISQGTGERHVIRITNFVIKLRNVFIKGDGERSREIIVVRNDGCKSAPLLVTSEVKVGVHAFKQLMANAVDASFYGRENDLLEMWDFIYAKGADRVVRLPLEVGRIHDLNGWLFGDCYINSNGNIVTPDSEGVMWINGNTVGLKPSSINVRNVANLPAADVPVIALPMSSSDRDSFFAEFVRNFVTNIGSLGPALTMLSWTNANPYSDFIFNKYGFFPFLFIWGRHGKGKTSITKWLLEMFGMDQIGSSTIPQLVSGVGFTRMLGYFSSLPLLLDEVRADKETREFYGHFRAWYNRQGRSMGSAKDSRSIITQDVKANIMFCGQDVFTDPATRSRCIEVQMPTHGRELEHTYLWIESHLEHLRSIGFQWVVDSTQCDLTELYTELQRYERLIVANARCDSRSAKHWAVVAYFSARIQRKAGIEFDMLSYIYGACSTGHEEQKTDDLVSRFFTVVEGLQCMEHTEINGSHIRVEDGKMYIWTIELIRLVRSRGGPGEGERFSSRAIASAAKDEECYLGEDRKAMGANGIRRRCHIFDIATAPEVIQNIAKFASKY